MRALYRKLGIGLSLLMAYQTEKASIRARTFRKSETTAEKRLWEELRGSRLNGFKFVRHLPIGPYFADCACRSVKLIVEVDGATHGDAHEVAYDAKRSLFLNEQGWAVHRITVIPHHRKHIPEVQGLAIHRNPICKNHRIVPSRVPTRRYHVMASLIQGHCLVS